ncbi:VWA domain-containing protein [Sedimenticola sp.]|uniref:VWA domain-containing protein n=1 Tax=Sedimenticola sp. TaxID=1940285 RepID=UPI003D136CC0
MKKQFGFSILELMVVTAIIAILVSIFLPKLQSERQTVSPTKIEKIKQTGYGTRGTDMSWPSMPSGSVAQADNLLAKNYMFVLDASGSMSDASCTKLSSKMDEARSAIMAFGESLDADSNIGLLTFSGKRISTVLPLSMYDQQRLKTALSTVYPSGSTPLADAMDVGFKALNDQAIKQLGNGQYNLVVVTDGQADKGQNVLGTVRQVVNTSPVMIHAVGFCIGNNHALNQQGLTRYVAASDGAALRKGLHAVLAEAPSFDASAFKAVQ